MAIRTDYGYLVELLDDGTLDTVFLVTDDRGEEHIVRMGDVDRTYDGWEDDAANAAADSLIV